MLKKQKNKNANTTSRTINIFEKAVRKAARSLLRDFGEIENLQIQTKGLGNFVTNADLKTEQNLIKTLKYYYPNCYIHY